MSGPQIDKLMSIDTWWLKQQMDMESPASLGDALIHISDIRDILSDAFDKEMGYKKKKAED